MDGWMDVSSSYSSAAQEKKKPAYHEETICAMYPWTVRSTIGKKDEEEEEEEEERSLGIGREALTGFDGKHVRYL